MDFNYNCELLIYIFISNKEKENVIFRIDFQARRKGQLINICFN